MIVEIDLRTVPPTVTLAEPDDFKGFEVRVQSGEEAAVAREELLHLAGARASDPAWLERLEEMVAYAESRGWIGADGSIRAHVDWSL